MLCFSSREIKASIFSEKMLIIGAFKQTTGDNNHGNGEWVTRGWWSVTECDGVWQRQRRLPAGWLLNLSNMINTLAKTKAKCHKCYHLGDFHIHKCLRFANSPTFFNFFPYTTFFNFYFCKICCFYTVGVEAGFRLCSGSGSGSMLFFK